MVISINHEYKDELIWRVRNSYISREANYTGNDELRYILNRLKQGGLYYGNYSSNKSFQSLQNSIVKVSYLQNKYENQWSAHGRYLQREGAQIEGKIGQGFDRESEAVDIASRLEMWQDQGDERLFKLIVSPQEAEKMDLRKHTRLLMERIERDYGVKLEWAAIDHYNTDNPHVHVVIRGRDDLGKEIRINKEYIRHGIRLRSKETATRQIGTRLMKDILRRREMAIQKNYITELDRDILRMANEHNLITFKNKLPKSAYDLEKRLHIIGRLQYLETLGFAEKKGVISWVVSEDMMKGLKAFQISNDIVKRRSLHHSAVSERKLPLVRTFLKEGEHIAGRVIGFGLHDENYDKRYALIEGLDGKVHYIHPTKSMIRQRDSYKIKNGDIVFMEVKSYFRNCRKKTYLKFTNWGKLDALKWNREITGADRYFIKHFLKQKKEFSGDIRTFRRKFFNMMQERIVKFQTLGHIDKKLNIKELKFRRK